VFIRDHLAAVSNNKARSIKAGFGNVVKIVGSHGNHPGFDSADYGDEVVSCCLALWTVRCIGKAYEGSNENVRRNENAGE
jgi:hypothetical protein